MEEMKVVINSNKIKDLKVGDAIYRSFYDFRVTEDDLKKARLELGETEEKKADSLLKLKDILIRDEDFHYRLDEEFLLRFLRYRKYNVEKAYSAIRNFYDLRNEFPDLFVVPSNLGVFLRKDVVRCLPYREKEGNVIYWGDTNNWKLDEMSLWDLMKIVHVVADVTVVNPCSQIHGITCLWDLGGLTVNHVTYFANPTVLRIFIKSMQSNYPWRVRRIIAFNSNALLKGLYHAFRYLLSKKIADRVIILGSDVNELHQYINPKILPKMYGGCIETSDCSPAQFVEDNLPYIKYERSFGPNIKV